MTEWFGGRIAVELRLWEAIDEGFLVPFQYFGVADGTDLSQLTWRRGGYATEELSNLLTGDDVRVPHLLDALNRILAAPERMRALGSAFRRSTRGTWRGSSPRPASERRVDRRRSHGCTQPGAGTTPERRVALSLLGGGARRRCRRSRRRLHPAPPPYLVRDRVLSTTGPRASAGRGEEPPDRGRSHRAAPTRVSLRGSSPRDPRSAARVVQSRLSPTSRFCPLGARSTSIARAARSCSTTSRRPYCAHVGQRSSPTSEAMRTP